MRKQIARQTAGAREPQVELRGCLVRAIEQFCAAVIAGTQATRTVRYFYRGRLVGEFQEPDWPARTAARQLYIEATGIGRRPVRVHRHTRLK